MVGVIDARLSELGIELPNAAAPAANYVPYVISGNTLYISGQVPFWNGELKGVGKVGKDLTAEDAQKIARICASTLLPRRGPHAAVTWIKSSGC